MAGQQDMAIITGLGSPTYDVAAVEDRKRNFYLWGAMGGAVALGLGLALARKDLDVLVVTGDGEMLMGMGSLATTAVKAPENLAILVLDNGLYGETGMQRSHAGLVLAELQMRGRSPRSMNCRQFATGFIPAAACVFCRCWFRQRNTNVSCRPGMQSRTS